MNNKLARLAEVTDLSEIKGKVDALETSFNDAADPYRSDREQLLARVRELEEEVARLEAELRTPNKIEKSFEWERVCRMCGCKKDSWGATPEQQTLYSRWSSAIYPKACVSFWCRLFKKPHAHQRCLACGAKWIVGADGWMFV